MSVIRLGSTEKFSQNWDKIFGGGKKSKLEPAAKAGSGKRKAVGKKGGKAKRGKK